MGNNRTRGFGFEREICNEIKKEGLGAKRAPGSDGRNLGEKKEVDILILSPSGAILKRAQAKRMKRLTALVKPDEGIDVQIVRADREEAYAVIRMSDYIQLLKKTGTRDDSSIVKRRSNTGSVLIRQRKTNQ